MSYRWREGWRERVRKRANGDVRPEGETEMSRQSVVLNVPVSTLGKMDGGATKPRIQKFSAGNNESSCQ